MKRLLASVLCVLLLMSSLPMVLADGGSSVTIDFTDKANRTAYSTEQQVWEQNGIVVTNDKGASTSNVGDYGGDGYPARFYKSSTVTIEYPGMTQLVIDCFGLDAKYINGWADSAVGVTATVYGTYVTIEFDGAVDSFTWETMSAQSRANKIVVYTGDAEPVVPDTPVDPEPDVPGTDPEADTELSIADVIALGLSKEHNTYTEGKYYVTGVITEVYNDVYGNMKLTDEAGNILTIYGTYNEDGTVRYDALEVKPVAGDTVKIYGIIGQYNGTAQIKNGWIVEHTANEGGSDTPVVPPVSGDAAVSVVDAPKAGVAYKFGMIQQNVSATDVYYLIGGMSGYYMATGSDVSAAIDVYLEETKGGYYCYAMVNGAKTYINMVVSGTHVNGAYEATASTVYTYDAEAKTIVANVNDAIYWFGTRNDKTYTTVGPCNIEYAGFYCQFYTVSGNVGGGETPDVPVTPEPPVSGDYVTITFDDLANRLSVSAEQQVWSMNGITVTNDKGASTSPVNEKYFAPVRFYKNSDVTVEYPGMTKIVFHCNTAAYATALADAIGVSAEDTLVTVELDGVDSYFCTMTVGQVRVDSIDVYSGEIGDTPVTPDPPAGDGDEDTLSIADAIAMGLAMEHNTFTEGKYYVTGVITEVYNTQYGNMKLTDDAGNILTIYGTYSADGELRYDAMEVKPVAGDTVTIYGIVGQYNGTAQIKNGWIVAHTPGEGGSDTPVDPPVIPDEGVVTDPQVGVGYRLGLYSTAKGAVYYFTGAMSGYYGATETNAELAVDMYLENAEGGYLLYFKDASGAKQYIKLEQSGTHYNFTFGNEGSVFTLDTELNALYATAGDKDCYMGTYGNYVTIGCMQSDKLSETDYLARLYVGSGATDIPVEPDYVGNIVAGNAEGSVGETVNVTVSFDANPGIISAKVKVYFDATALKLVNYAAGNFSAGGYSWSDISAANEKGYFIVNWCDAINADSTADLLATLSFEILEGAAGSYAITLQFSCDDDMFNAADETVWFKDVAGSVTVVEKPTSKPGDLNGDGKINNKDLGLLQQYLADWDIAIDLDAADVNNDGKINNKDLGLVQQYLADWDVVLK